VKFACSQKCYEHFWLFLSVHIPIFCWLDPWSWWVIFFFVGGRFYMYIYTCFNFEHLLVKSMFWLRNHLFVLLNPIFFPFWVV
jgi:hypothetical protein